ncbi:MAG TPA: hypothetical protein VHC22_17300 [Pirellulales bacterium]|nr:hypothetical protein [Pirellulales bacterium]
MRIVIDDHYSLTEIRPEDKRALVEHLNDREIYERTLRIPHPYRESDAEAFFAFVEAENDRFGERVTSLSATHTRCSWAVAVSTTSCPAIRQS